MTTSAPSYINHLRLLLRDGLARKSRTNHATNKRGAHDEGEKRGGIHHPFHFVSIGASPIGEQVLDGHGVGRGEAGDALDAGGVEVGDGGGGY